VKKATAGAVQPSYEKIDSNLRGVARNCSGIPGRSEYQRGDRDSRKASSGDCASAGVRPCPGLYAGAGLHASGRVRSRCSRRYSTPRGLRAATPCDLCPCPVGGPSAEAVFGIPRRRSLSLALRPKLGGTWSSSPLKSFRLLTPQAEACRASAFLLQEAEDG
jgi:hypothetical protein